MKQNTCVVGWAKDLSAPQ